MYLSLCISKHFLDCSGILIPKKKLKILMKWYTNTFIKPLKKIKRKLKIL